MVSYGWTLGLVIGLVVVVAVYVFAAPCANAPNVAGAASVSKSVAGTLPLTVVAARRRWPARWARTRGW